MPVEVLVLCTGCGRPEFAHKRTCPSCGHALPEAVGATKEPDADEKRRLELIGAHEPHLSVDTGQGQTLLLSQKRLELWARAKRVMAVPVTDLTLVGLAKRPAWEALLLLAPATGIAAFAPWGWLRLAMVLLGSLSIAACVFQERYALVLVRKDGARARFGFGIAKPRSAQADRLLSTFDSLATELHALGVSTKTL